MTALWVLIGSIVLPTAIGHFALRFLEIPRDGDRLATLSWSWMTGALITALAVFLQAATFGVGSRWSAVAVVLWVMAVLLPLKWRGNRRTKPFETTMPPAEPLRAKDGIVARIGSLFGYVLFFVSLWLIVGYAAEANKGYILSGDELLIWKAKAKAIYAAGGLNDRFADAVVGETPLFPIDHADYPLLNPLLQLLVFMSCGRVTHWESRIPMQVAMAALVVALNAALRRRTHPAIAGLLTFLFAASPWTDQLSGLAYSDHLVAFGFLVAIDAAMRAAETGRREFHRIAAIGFAFCLAAKNEGAMLLCVSIAAWFVASLIERRGRIKCDLQPKPLASLLYLPIAVLLLQWLVNRHFGLRNDLWEGKDGRPFFLLAVRQWSSNARTVAEFFGAALLTIAPPWKLPLEVDVWWIRRTRHFTLIPATLFAAMIALRPRLRGMPYFRPLLAVLFAVLGYMIVYIGTPRPLVWHLTTSMFRVLFTIYPATALLLGTIFGGVFPPMTRLPARRADAHP